MRKLFDKSITLVLGGLGVKGVASIGVLQALNSQYIKVKKIYASGASALVAGYYAMGGSPNELIDRFVNFFTSYDKALWGLEQMSGLFQIRRRRIRDSFAYFLQERLYCRANMKRISILNWDIVEPLITEVFGDHTFSDLKIPVAISTVDLSTKQILIIDTGKLVDGMKASIAFPGLFPPVRLNEHQLVSSTICCELPLDTISRLDSPSLAVDFPTIVSNQRPEDLLEIIARTTEIRSNAIKLRLLEKVDYIVKLERMNRFRWGNYRTIPQMIQHAREQTDRQLTTIQKSQSARLYPARVRMKI